MHSLLPCVCLQGRVLDVDFLGKRGVCFYLGADVKMWSMKTGPWTCSVLYTGRPVSPCPCQEVSYQTSILAPSRRWRWRLSRLCFS